MIYITGVAAQGMEGDNDIQQNEEEPSNSKQPKLSLKRKQPTRSSAYNYYDPLSTL